MSEIVSFNGLTYTVPDTGDQAWGDETTAYLVALSQGTFQKNSGSFPLTATADFGANFGLLALYFGSRSASLSTAGVLRLAVGDSLGWRNNAGTGNLLLAVNSSNQLTFNGVAVTTGDSINSLSNDVTTGTPVGGVAAATVVTVGGVSSSAIASSVTVVAAATTSAVSNTLSLRDSSANITASTFNGALNGNASTATSATTATSFSGPLVGDVTGIQGATVVSQVGGVSASTVASSLIPAGGITNANLSGSAAISNANLATMAANTVKGNSTGSPAVPTDLAFAATNTASTVVFRNGAGDTAFNQVVQKGATTVAAGGTTVLTSTSAMNQILTASASLGQTYTLPDETTLSLTGVYQYQFINRSSGNLQVNDSSGGAVVTVSTGQSAAVKSVANGSATGNWVVANTSNSGSGVSITLAGDVTGSGTTGGTTTTTVALVGGAAASAVAAASTSVSTATNLSTASTLVRRDANGNANFNQILLSNQVTNGVGGTTALLNSSSNTQYLVGGAQTYSLPSGLTLSPNVSYTFLNLSSGILSVTDFSSNAIASVAVGASATIAIYNATSTAGLWSVSYLNSIPSATAATASTLAARDSSGNLTANAFNGSATSFSGSLVGDVTGTQGATVVSQVGGVSAATVASSLIPAGGITTSNISSTAGITNSQLATMGSTTVKGNATGSPATPTDISFTSAASANTIVFRNSSKNITVNWVDQTLLQASLSGTPITMTAASGPNVILSGSTGQLVLPAGTSLNTGHVIKIVNTGTGSASVVAQDGSTVVATVATGQTKALYLTSNATANGVWNTTSTIFPESTTAEADKLVLRDGIGGIEADNLHVLLGDDRVGLFIKGNLTQTDHLVKLVQNDDTEVVTISNEGDGDFAGDLTAANLSGSNQGDVTLGTANGLSLSTQQLSLQASTDSQPGAMTAADHTKLSNAYASTSTASPVAFSGTLCQRDLYANAAFNTVVENVTFTVSSNQTVTMDESYSAIQVITGTDDVTFTLPAEDSFSDGVAYHYEFINQSSGSLVVKESDGTTLVTLTSGRALVTSLSTASPTGNWDVQYGEVSLGTANGLSLSGQTLSLQAADASHTGALTSTDWSTFNGKQNALTLGTGIATFLSSPSSANLASAVINETGSGALVFANTPTLVTPNIGAAGGTSLNLSGAVTASNFTGSSSNTNTGDQLISATGDVVASANSSTLTTAIAFIQGETVDGTTGSGNVVFDTAPTIDSPVLLSPQLGTPASGDLSNCSGTAASLTAGSCTTIPSLSGDVSSSGNAVTLGTVNSNVGSFGGAAKSLSATVNAKGLITAISEQSIAIAESQVTSLVSDLAAKAPLVSPSFTTPALGTPSAGVLTNCTGTASGLTAGSVTTNANLTGPITSSGNATSVAAQTGTGSTFVMQTSPTLTTPLLGTPTSGTLTNCTGLPISSGISGLGTGIATFLSSPSSANLASAITDESGSGSLLFSTSPTIAAPTLTGNINLSGLTASQAVTLDASKNLTSIAYASGNTLSAIVRRDSSGGFIAGDVNANLIGTVNSIAVATVTAGSALANAATNLVTASTIMKRGASGNCLINEMIRNVVSTATAAGTTTLTTSSNPIQVWTGSTTQTIKTFDATSANTVGFTFDFINQSSGSLTIQNNGAGALTTVPAGTACQVRLVDGSTSNGTWDVRFFGSVPLASGTNGYYLGYTSGIPTWINPDAYTFWVYLATTATPLANANIIYDTVRNNPGTGYSTSTGLLTCPSTGFYTVSLSYTPTLALTGYVYLYSTTDAGNIAYLIPTGVGAGSTFTASAIVYLVSGQTYAVRASSSQALTAADAYENQITIMKKV